MRAATIAGFDEHDTVTLDQMASNEAVESERNSLADRCVEQFVARPELSTSNATPIARTNRRRQISPQSGKALEVLGHAIEYLADEFALRGQSTSAPSEDPQVRAMQILMAANRSVYYESPIVPTPAERFRDAWNRRTQHKLWTVLTKCGLWSSIAFGLFALCVLLACSS
jgi:hypothetical protein